VRVPAAARVRAHVDEHLDAGVPHELDEGVLGEGPVPEGEEQHGG